MRSICKKCGADLDKTNRKHRNNCPVKNETQEDESGLTINPGVVGPTSTNEIGDDGGGVTTMDKPELGGGPDADPGNTDYGDSGDVDVGGSD